MSRVSERCLTSLLLDATRVLGLDCSIPGNTFESLTVLPRLISSLYRCRYCLDGGVPIHLRWICTNAFCQRIVLGVATPRAARIDGASCVACVWMVAPSIQTPFVNFSSGYAAGGAGRTGECQKCKARSNSLVQAIFFCLLLFLGLVRY